MNICRAMCCQGPLLLELAEDELPSFVEQATMLGVKLEVSKGLQGGGWVKFSDHEGERCPMLDPHTFACLIYENRPRRCREFPEKWTPGCPISGG
jgi:Fe-S-cluster containining protein